MLELLVAPDLSRKKKLIEAPDLLGSISKPAPKDDLADIRNDIAKLSKAVGKIVKTEFNTIDSINDLSKEQGDIVASLNELTVKVKQTDGLNDGIETTRKTTDKYKEEITRLTQEIGGLSKTVTEIRERKRYTTVGGGGLSRAQAVKAVKEDGGVMLSEVISPGLKRVKTINVEPDTGELVVLHEE